MLSLIIVTHNRLEQLKRVIPSIERQETPYELIVVDDGSTDETLEFVSTAVGWGVSGDEDGVFYYRIPEHYWRNPSYAKNIGVSLARQDVVIVQDAEILHESPILEIVDDFFYRANGYGCPIMLLPEGAWYEEQGKEPEWQPVPARTCMLLAMQRRDFIELGGFNEKWYTQWGNDDVEFTDRVEAAEGVIVEHPSIKIRHLAHEPVPPGNYDRWIKECHWKDRYVERLKAGKARPYLKWRH